jgi:hypothetical protein
MRVLLLTHNLRLIATVQRISGEYLISIVALFTVASFAGQTAISLYVDHIGVQRKVLKFWHPCFKTFRSLHNIFYL